MAANGGKRWWWHSREVRDAFYACLDKESNKRPTEIASVGLLYPSECKNSRAEFDKNTAVKHFDRQYRRNRRVQRLLDDKDLRRGPLMLPQTYTFKSS
ncbi:hypothetical protein CFP56_020158 [Quercus suber]|uniref:Uncharacterized protein n=1 Tax=Quercus suber TaxID=58331 RepID=A0AAW0KGN0_QUESU